MPVLDRRLGRGHNPAAVDQRADETRTAGRGLILIAGAKVYFIITAYAVHFLLPRLLGSPESFGLFSTAMSAVSILNNVLIASTVQTVSKLVSEDEGRAPVTLRQGLRIQLVVGGVLAGLFFLAAPVLAARFLRDPTLTPLLQTGASVVLAYALYATLVGSLNGRRLFSRQAGLDATFSTLRTVGILTGAVVGVGALGAITGFASAALGVLLIALLVVGLGRRGEALPLGRWLGFMAPLWAFQIFLNGILLIDVLVLKGTVADLAVETGMDAAAAAALASEQVGFYSAAQKFAFVPYQLMLSMTFVVFPMISRATSMGDAAAARETIRGAMRFSLLVLVAVAAPIAGAADGIMTLAYPDEYLAGSGALGVLVFGAAAFALFVITATAMSGSGRPGVSAVIGAVGLAAVVVGNRVLVEMVGIGDQTVVAAAAGTTIGMVLALIAGGAVIKRTFGAFMPPLSVARALFAGTVAFSVARWVPHTGLMAVVALAAGFAAYLAALAATRELGPADLATVRRILRRK